VVDFLSLAVEGVRGLKPYEPGKPIETLERELGLTDIVKLASNENPLGPGERAHAALAAAIGEVGRYPDGNGFALKEALSRHLGAPPEALTLGNGSNDVLELVVRAFASSEHEVVFSEHAFAVYPLATQAVGARAVVTPARAFGHDLEAMASAVSERTRVVFVANPNNPTGTWSSREAVERLLAAVPERVLVVVDEAYREYVEAPGYPDCVRLLERHPNLVVTRTFSKVHGLAGLRVGYAVSDPRLAEILNRVRQPFNVNAPALHAAAAALEDREHVERSRVLNREGLARLGAAFEAMGLDYVPSVANFISVDVGGPAEPVYERLLREGIIVRPIGGYKMPRHLRVTVGLPEENERFLAALGRVLASRRSP